LRMLCQYPSSHLALKQQKRSKTFAWSRDRLLSMRPEDFERYVEFEERLGEAVSVIEQVITAVIDRLPDKKEEEP
jgi:hypothetical protein